MIRLLKKSLAFILALTMVFGAAPLAGLVGLELPSLKDVFAGKAEAATYGVLTYEINNGEVKITDCDESASGELVIPDEIEGYPVTSIGNSAFENCASLTRVTIPDSVTSIGSWAFNSCTGLTSVTIPDSVTSIGGSAFSNCTKLISVIIGNSVMSIAQWGFSGCISLTSVLIPNSVTSIDLYAFENCSSLASITIPDSVTSIGTYAFSGCTELTSLTIGNGVTSIGKCAFYDCKALTSVTIPDSVTSIGYDAFGGCTGLTSVNYNGNLAKWCSIGFDGYTSNPMCYANSLYIEGKKVEGELVIPDDVTRIGKHAFLGCAGLTSVTIPDSVTSINIGAFNGCSGLSSITVDESNQYYSSDEYGALFNKDKTELILYPIGNEKTEYIIPDSVTSIGGGAFSDCAELTSVTIPDSVTSIGGGAFSSCTGLINLIIGNGVTSIQPNAFTNCHKLTSVTIPDSVTFIGTYAFNFCKGLISVKIGNNSTVNGKIFQQCDSLESIFVENNHPTHSNDNYGVLFNKNKTELIQYPIGSKLTGYTIPNSVTNIGDYAFYYCTTLTEIKIPESVKSIGFNTFLYCTSITDVYYAGTEEQWKAISIRQGNDCIKNATIHYNSVPAGSSDELKLNREALTISNNVCPVITVTEYPEGVKAEDLVWSSSNSEVASVNSENVVTPNHYGKTEIKVETKDGKYSATCELTVEASFVITSDSSSVKSLRCGDTAEYRIYFYNYDAEELPVDDVELSIKGGDSLQINSYGVVDNYLYVNVNAVSEGAGLIEVYSDSPLAYNKFKISVYPENIDWRADKVPNYTEKNTENFRRSTFVVENYNYIYDENTGMYTVSMDVYNKTGDYPVLASYNSSGEMVDFDVAERFIEMPGDWGSFLGTLGFGAVQMVTGDLFTYRAINRSKKTTVSVKVPADGYVTISNDITASPAAAIVNLGGLMIEIVSLTCNLSEEDSEKNKDVTKEFVKSLKEKLPDSDKLFSDLVEKFTEKVTKKVTREYVIGVTQFSQEALYELCNEAGSSFAEIAGDAFKSVLKKDIKSFISKSAMEKLIKEDMVEASVLSKLKAADKYFKAGNLLALVDYALHTLKFNNGSGITTIQFNPCGENGFVCKDTIKIVSNVIDEDTVLQHFIIKDAGKLAITKQELQIDPKDIVELHEIALIKDGKKIEGVEFKATVEMDIPKTMFAPTVKVFRIEKDGSYTKLETKVKDGKITFTTDHFSEYVLTGRSIDEAVSGVSLNAEAVDIVNKQTYQLVATVSPETAPNKSLIWSSGNENVATVDENGLVSSVSPGTAVITATTVDGGFKANCKITVIPRTFSVTWVVEGIETTSEISEGSKITKPDNPIKKGYSFAGWTPEVPEIMPSEDITFFAVFECVSGISIKNNPGTKTIKYGETLKLTAITTNMPTGANIYWFVDGVKKGEGETFEVSPKNGSIEITVKIVDENGNVLIDKNGNEIQDSEKASVNSGLWQKIVSFFKNLFKMNRTVVQAIFKGIF